MSSSLTIQHCQIIALNGYLLILPASSLLSPTRISQISRIFFVASKGTHYASQENSEGVEIREIRGIRVGKLNINH